MHSCARVASVVAKQAAVLVSPHAMSDLVLRGRVIRLVDGAVNSEVTLEVAPGIEIVSIITKASVESLGLAVGSDAFAVIKASSVMVAVE